MRRILPLGLIVLLGVGGCITDPQVQAELQALRLQGDQTAAEIKASVEQAERIAKKIKEAIAALKAGTLTPEDAQKVIESLVAERAEVLAHVDSLRTKAENIAAEATRIHETYGVPWWQIAGWGVLSLLSILGGGKAVQLKGNLGAALGAVSQLVGAIEQGPAEVVYQKEMNGVELSEVKAIKGQVKALDNPVIEMAVKELQAAAVKP